MGDWSDRNSWPSSPIQTDQLHFCAFCPVSETSYFLLSPSPPLPSYTLILCAVAVGPTSSCGVWSKSFMAILSLNPCLAGSYGLTCDPAMASHGNMRSPWCWRFGETLISLVVRDMCRWFWPCLYSSASLHGQHCACFSLAALSPCVHKHDGNAWNRTDMEFDQWVTESMPANIWLQNSCHVRKGNPYCLSDFIQAFVTCIQKGVPNRYTNMVLPGKILFRSGVWD